MDRKLLRSIAALVALFATLAFAGGSAIAQDDDDDDMDDRSGSVATIAPLHDPDGNQLGLVGIVEDDDDDIDLVVAVQGLTAGDHGIHLHQTGVCEPDGDTAFGAAGGHFNPENATHPQHAGDLGNLTADANGNAIFLISLDDLTLDDGPMGLADADGTALVIHADPDDLATDPSGNSGGRIACAVIAAPQA
jgi:superoxide dismutase, Cu-Zn family